MWLFIACVVDGIFIAVHHPPYLFAFLFFNFVSSNSVWNNVSQCVLKMKYHWILRVEKIFLFDFWETGSSQSDYDNDCSHAQLHIKWVNYFELFFFFLVSIHFACNRWSWCARNLVSNYEQISFFFSVVRLKTNSSVFYSPTR